MNKTINNQALDLNTILEMIFQLREDVWKLWTFCTTVNLAVIGWIVTLKGLDANSQKVIASVGCLANSIFMLMSFVKAYKGLIKAQIDLNSIADLDCTQTGYIGHLKCVRFTKHLYEALVVNIFASIIIQILIWDYLPIWGKIFLD